MLGLELAQRVDRIRRAGAADLPLVQHESPVARQSGADHRHTVLGCGAMPGRFKRLRARRHEAYLVQLEPFRRLPGDAEMAAMYRIERAAEYADAHRDATESSPRPPGSSLSALEPWGSTDAGGHRSPVTL